MNTTAELKKDLEKALKHEKKGDLNAALSCYNDAFNLYPEDRLTVLFEMSFFLFRAGRYSDALDRFVQCHKGGYKTAEIEDIVMEAYYTPNINEFAGSFQKNIDFLETYEAFDLSDFPAFADLRFKFIPFSKGKYIIFDTSRKSFSSLIDVSRPTQDIKFVPRQIWAVKNGYNTANLTALEKGTYQDNSDSFAITQMPVFLIYDSKEEFLEYLQILNFFELLETNRIIFLFGLKETIDYFNKGTAVFPNLYIGMQKNDPYYIQIEKTKTAMLKEEKISYRNLMQMFSASFDS